HIVTIAPAPAIALGTACRSDWCDIRCQRARKASSVGASGGLNNWSKKFAIAPRLNTPAKTAGPVTRLRSIIQAKIATEAKSQTSESAWTETEGTVRRSLPTANGIRKAGAARTPNQVTNQ